MWLQCWITETGWSHSSTDSKYCQLINHMLLGPHSVDQKHVVKQVLMQIKCQSQEVLKSLANKVRSYS